jgi:hypothetical protein
MRKSGIAPGHVRRIVSTNPASVASLFFNPELEVYMKTWYVLDDSTDAPTPIGPFTLEQISQMVSAGSLHARSRVAPTGSSEWVEAAHDPVLAALFGTHPPTSPDGVAPVSPSAAIGPFSFGAALSLAYASFKARWSAWMRLTLGMIGISVVIVLLERVMNNLGQSAMRDGGRGSGTLLSPSGAVLQFFVGGPLGVGSVYAAAKIHAGEPQFADLFAGFRRYGTALGSSLLLVSIYFAVGVAASILMFGSVALAMSLSGGGAGARWVEIVGLLAVVVLVVGLSARVLMRVNYAPVIAIDPAFGNPGVIGAFRISWANSKGVGPSMLGLAIVGGLLAMASYLLLCVGIIFVGLPLLLSIQGAMYVMVHRNRATSQLPSP